MATGRALSIERSEERKRKQRGANGVVPTPLVAGVSTMPQNPALMGGARGIGFDQPGQGASDAIARAVAAGVPMSALGDTNPSGDTNIDRPDSYVKSRLSTGDSANFLKSFGLSGLMDDAALAGLTQGEANRRAAEERQLRMGQVTANTSSVFNPEIISGTKKVVDRLNLSLTDINRDPFSSKGTKNEKLRSALDASAKEIASLFGSPQDFTEAQLYNPQLVRTLKAFSDAGGRVEDIEGRINTVPMPGATPPEKNVQDTGSYLAALTNPAANPEAERRAIDELIPERELTQQEIARQSRIPQQMIDLYFGTESQVGLLKQKEMQAIEQKRILEEKERDEQNSLRSRAKMALERNKVDLQIEESKIEQNRLAAKNYMTGMLAKLGALSTTGAAPLALQTLETKYQGHSQQLRTAYRFDTQAIENGLDEALNGVENNTDEAVLRLQEDLTKDYETISKEITKLEQASEKEIFNLSTKYATQLRQRTATHTAELKREAEKYAAEFLKAASTGIDLFSLAKATDGTLTRTSKKNAITSSYQTIKNDIKQNLPPAIATKIITELTDEQMSIFLEDYLAERVGRQRSVDPVGYYETWKKTNAPAKDEEDEYKPVY